MLVFFYANSVRILSPKDSRSSPAEIQSSDWQKHSFRDTLSTGGFGRSTHSRLRWPSDSVTRVSSIALFQPTRSSAKWRLRRGSWF